MSVADVLEKGADGCLSTVLQSTDKSWSGVSGHLGTKKTPRIERVF